MAKEESNPLTAENLALHTESTSNEYGGKLSFIMDYVRQQRNLVLRDAPHPTASSALSILSDDSPQKDALNEEEDLKRNLLQSNPYGWQDKTKDSYSPPQRKVAQSMRTKGGSTPADHPIKSRSKRSKSRKQSNLPGDSSSKRQKLDKSGRHDTESEMLPPRYISTLRNSLGNGGHNRKQQATRKILSESSYSPSASPRRPASRASPESTEEAARHTDNEQNPSLEVQQKDQGKKTVEKVSIKVGKRGAKDRSGAKAPSTKKPERAFRDTKKEKAIKLATKVMEVRYLSRVPTVDSNFKEICQDFKAPNVGANRLTIKGLNFDRPSKLGIFNKGRKSERDPVRGAPDIVFNEKRFLEQDAGPQKSRQKTKDDNKKISAYFQQLRGVSPERRNTRSESAPISDSPIKQSIAVENAGDGLSKEEVTKAARKALEDVMPPINAKRNGRRMALDEEDQSDHVENADRMHPEKELENIIVDVGEAMERSKAHERTRNRDRQAGGPVDLLPRPSTTSPKSRRTRAAAHFSESPRQQRPGSSLQSLSSSDMENLEEAAAPTSLRKGKHVTTSGAKLDTKRLWDNIGKVTSRNIRSRNPNKNGSFPDNQTNFRRQTISWRYPYSKPEFYLPASEDETHPYDEYANVFDETEMADPTDNNFATDASYLQDPSGQDVSDGLYFDPGTMEYNASYEKLPSFHSYAETQSEQLPEDVAIVGIEDEDMPMVDRSLLMEGDGFDGLQSGYGQQPELANLGPYDNMGLEMELGMDPQMDDLLVDDPLVGDFENAGSGIMGEAFDFEDYLFPTGGVAVGGEDSQGSVSSSKAFAYRPHRLH
ncbi:hypothetical protein HDV00_007467 [Rhizophlyctis rosea]|nr:hypothetical protein HDV00_007467 [Rhizophlyctis rosea]